MQRSDETYPPAPDAGPASQDGLTSAARLLSSEDPEPVVIERAESSAPVVFVCEHAGNVIPAKLGLLGLSRSHIETHIGWDVGALGVARRVAEVFEAPLVHQRYSRLVYDCNRPPGAADAIPEFSDGVLIPGNIGLSEADMQARRDEIFAPYDAAVRRVMRNQTRAAAFAVHSFTPVMGGQARPWHLGLLYRSDLKTAQALRDTFLAKEPDLLIGMNEPYAVDDTSDWFIPRHAERMGLVHCLFEIRHDLIADEAGQRVWADRLARAIRPLLDEMT